MIFVLTYFVVLVLDAVFEISFHHFFVLVLVFQLFLSFSLVSVLHYFFVSVFVFDFIMYVEVTLLQYIAYAT